MIEELKSAAVEIDYSFRDFAAGHRAGSHASNTVGAGLEFRTLASLMSHPDFRRIDVAATKRTQSDPPMVRIFEQQQSIDVILMADLTASMNFKGIVHKKRELAKLTVCLAYSAYRNGDHFGFVGYDNEIRFYFPPMFSKEAPFEIGETIWNFEPIGKKHDTRSALDHLPNQPSLIFWVSDFHFPESLIGEFLDAARHHEIIPIIMSDPAEYALPKFGILNIYDPEAKETRFMFLTPALREKIRNQFNEKREAVKAAFEKFNIKFMEINGRFDPTQITNFFNAEGGAG